MRRSRLGLRPCRCDFPSHDHMSAEGEIAMNVCSPRTLVRVGFLSILTAATAHADLMPGDAQYKTDPSV